MMYWRPIRTSRLPCCLLFATIIAPPTALAVESADDAVDDAALSVSAPPPWRPRLRHGLRRPFKGFARLGDWPAEPAPPPSVDADRLARALRELCGERLSVAKAADQARWMVQYGKQFGVDPFLIGALAYRRSRCNPRFEHRKDGHGLLGISLRMHASSIKGGRYRYWRWEGAYWRQHERAIDRFPLTRRSLQRAEPNIYFGAALLSIYRDQCPHIDRAFRAKPHRHFVSHFVFGDRVLGARAEDWILQARRRLLGYYDARTIKAVMASFRDLPLRSPLDGSPRSISSEYGTPRGTGRRHRGVDFHSTWGEPVRAVADGVVAFAGVQPRGGRARPLGPTSARRISRRRMGIGGLFVIIEHASKVTSGYFHLSRFTVRKGQPVTAGQIVGYVGRSGIKSSPSHLHFELRLRGWNINPTRRLRPFLIWPGKRSKRQPIG